jgi:hypothetical protein
LSNPSAVWRNSTAWRAATLASRRKSSAAFLAVTPSSGFKKRAGLAGPS